MNRFCRVAFSWIPHVPPGSEADSGPVSNRVGKEGWIHTVNSKAAPISGVAAANFKPKLKGAAYLGPGSVGLAFITGLPNLLFPWLLKKEASAQA